MSCACADAKVRSPGGTGPIRVGFQVCLSLPTGTAEAWPLGRVAALNTIAIDCRPGPQARLLSRVAGLPDDAFEHDGKLTKRAIRAATLAALAPLPGETLWDVGAGSGSVAIEWLRASRSLQAIAIERDAARAATIARKGAARRL